MNCPFYFKIGACRHGDRCSRLHNKPSISQTLLLPNMFVQKGESLASDGKNGSSYTQVCPPVRANGDHASDSRKDDPDGDAAADPTYFDDFFEDVFEVVSEYGEVEMLNVCDNKAEHMLGNVYIKFSDEAGAKRAFDALTKKDHDVSADAPAEPSQASDPNPSKRYCYYEGRPLKVEFSPVTDFRESTCRQYEESSCARGGFCNFMHLKQPSRMLRARLFGKQREKVRKRREEERERYQRRRQEGDQRENGTGDYADDDYAYDRRRGRSRSRSRSRSMSRERENSEERRKKIAEWSRAKKMEQDQTKETE